jgi:5-methylcytosine-specific restriction endonuclease McrA
MDLADFDPTSRDRIVKAALSPRKPARWIDFGLAQIESRAWYEWHWHRGIDPEKKRRSLSQYTRQFVIERDGLWCRLCGGDVHLSDVDIDHVVPVSLGGTDKLDNLQVTHSRCNRSKGNRV